MKLGWVLFTLIIFVGAASPQEFHSWNFDSDRAGVIPKGFTNEKGEWRVVSESTAPSPPNVLAQLAKNYGSTFNLTLITGANYKDVDVSVKMKAVAGKEDQGGGLVWRAKDKDSYYVARYNPLEENYRFYKVVKGKRSELKSTKIENSEGWHTLRVTMKGNLVQGYNG